MSFKKQVLRKMSSDEEHVFEDSDVCGLTELNREIYDAILIANPGGISNSWSQILGKKCEFEFFFCEF